MKIISGFRSDWLAAGMALGTLVLPGWAQIPWATEQFSRQNKVEVYGIGQYLHQGDVEYSDRFGGSTKMHLDDTGLGGLGVAFHFNDFLAVHADFMFGPATFTISGPNTPAYQLGNSGLLQSGRFNLDYNIINRRLTPFITAGLGYQYLQVDQGDSYYYHDGGYYGGYYYYNYYSETDFTLNVGGGLRWNITDNLFIKLTGGAQWVFYQDAQNVPMQIEAFFAIGGTFP